MSRDAQRPDFLFLLKILYSIALANLIQRDQFPTLFQIPIFPTIAGRAVHEVTARLVDATLEAVHATETRVGFDDGGARFVFGEE